MSSAASVDSLLSKLNFGTGRPEAKFGIIKIRRESEGGKAMQVWTVSIFLGLRMHKTISQDDFGRPRLEDAFCMSL